MRNLIGASPRAVVLGAGYAGVTAARVIAKHSNATVTLINDSDRFQERMRNHQVATGQQLRDVRLRDLVEDTGIHLAIDRAVHLDPESREIRLAGDAEPLGYDVLVYALGSHADLSAVPGAAEHATPVATVNYARRVGDRVGDAGTIAVVGGGLTGIETVTELAETYPDRKVVLVTRGAPGGMLNDRGREHLFATFERLGIEVRTGATVAKVAEDGLLLEDGSHLDADGVVWTAGFGVPTLAREAGLAVDHRGRMLVDSTMRSTSYPDIYAVGDAAAARNERGDEVRMGCGPGGIAGVTGARSIADRLAGRKPKPYRYHDVAWCISLGRRDGVIQLGPGNRGRIVTGRKAAYVKERVLRGAVYGLCHPRVAVAGASFY